MLNQKELKKIRSIIDEYVPTDDEEAMEIREKICDLIQLKKAWNVNKHIQCTVVD